MFLMTMEHKRTDADLVTENRFSRRVEDADIGVEVSLHCRQFCLKPWLDDVAQKQRENRYRLKCPPIMRSSNRERSDGWIAF